MGLPRVVVDLETLSQINAGLGRFSLFLANALLEVCEGQFCPVFFMPGKTEGFLPSGGYEIKRVSRWKKESTNRVFRPLASPWLPKSKYALWHATNQHSKYLPFDSRVPVVLTIHDLNFLHEPASKHSAKEIDRKVADMQRRVDRAQAVTAISRFVADDVGRHLDLRGKRIRIVSNGMAPAPTASIVRPAFVPLRPFLFSIGNFLEHKNFHVLLGLAERMPETVLVIAGNKTTPYGQFIEKEVARRGLSSRIVLPGEVSDPDRQWLYKNCEAFLFPSLTEGFGFPVLEAMQCGKPVFISRRTSLPEVAGDHGYFFDSFDAAHMESVVQKGLREWQADRDLALRSKAHAATFTWQRAAAQYAAIYSDVLNGCG